MEIFSIIIDQLKGFLNYQGLLDLIQKGDYSVFKTYQPAIAGKKVVYGITREVDPGNFSDAYFGEIVLLAKDVYQAPGLVNKIKYLFMPPGWSHTGDHKTVKAMRASQTNNYS